MENIALGRPVYATHLQRYKVNVFSLQVEIMPQKKEKLPPVSHNLKLLFIFSI